MIIFIKKYVSKSTVDIGSYLMTCCFVVKIERSICRYVAFDPFFGLGSRLSVYKKTSGTQIEMSFLFLIFFSFGVGGLVCDKSSIN